ncbi:MAG: TRAP transporter large permease subunit, partial [Cetobacterium sp.]|nr:TRAP transporter large permease subunit [Cetobacterium sp.]
GGIFSGYFTPTEAAVIATCYSMLLGFFVYKELTVKGFISNVIETIKISGVTVLMIMGVTFFGQVIAREQISMKIADIFLTFGKSPLMVLIMINILLIFLGTFIEALALQVLVLPMLIPVVVQFGMDPVFFGVISTLNLMIGILTPPMGMALFVVSRVGGMSVSTITKGVIPFLIPILVTLIILILFPSLTLFVPNLILGAG